MFDVDAFKLEWQDRFKFPDVYENELVFDTDVGPLSITTFFMPFTSKEQYLFFLLTDKQMDQSHIDHTVKMLQLDDKPDVHPALVEVGWQYEGLWHQKELPQHIKTKLLMDFVKQVKRLLKQGYAGYSPQAGIMLTAIPKGFKDPFVWTDQSAETGRNQRAMFAKRVGFGDVQPDGICYGIYDANGKVQPL